MYFDSSMLILIPAILLSLYASSKVKSAFAKFSKVRTQNGLTGAMAAEEILRRNNVYDVRIERVAGNLTDHYDPTDNVIRLSDTVYGSASISAVGVAAHEAGHALQYAAGYAPIKIRASIIPVTQIGSTLSWPILLLGMFLSFPLLINIGILLFCAVVVFQLVTLPVEYNASTRAMRALDENGLLSTEELVGAKAVLSAAALTYVAALASALAQLLRLLTISRRRR